MKPGVETQQRPKSSFHVLGVKCSDFLFFFFNLNQSEIPTNFPKNFPEKLG